MNKMNGFFWSLCISLLIVVSWSGLQGCSTSTNADGSVSEAAQGDAGSGPDLTFPPHSKAFRLVTLNIPFFPLGVKMGRHEERMTSLVDIITKMSKRPHVLTLQEVWLNSIKKALGDKFKKLYPHQYQDLTGQGALNSGLMILSVYPITKSGIKHYKDSFGNENLATKGVAGVELALSKTKKLYVFTTHLQSSSKPEANETKIKQLREAKSFIEGFTKDNQASIFLTGDFNLSIEKNKEYLGKAKAVFSYVRDTFDPPKGKEVKASTWGGMNGTGFAQRIDHIWVLRESQDKIKGFSYIIKDIDDKTSNHLAVWGEFETDSL